MVIFLSAQIIMAGQTFFFFFFFLVAPLSGGLTGWPMWPFFASLFVALQILMSFFFV